MSADPSKEVAPATDLAEKPSPAQPSSPKAGGKSSGEPSKCMRGFYRFLRTSFAIFVAFMPILSFGLTVTSLVSASWAHKSVSADDTRWVDISPVNGNCTCNSTHTSYCAETSDAFEGTAYLSVTVICAQLVLSFIYSVELGWYGLFGGSHNFTRITLIVALLALSTQILSVISWYATYDNDHCGDPSFADNGAALGGPFFVRCVECVFMFGFVLYITSLFPKNNRGPPSIPLFASVIAMLVTSLTTFLRGWMTLGDYSYSPWSACLCGDACSSVSGMLTMALAAGAIATFAGLVTVFFMTLRAVDNEGLTLKASSIASAVTVVLQLLVVLGFYLAFNGGCGDSLENDGFELFWPSNFAIGALVTQIAFLISNSVYMLKACCGSDEEPAAAAAASGEDNAAAAQAEAFKQTIYYRYWWDLLKDPRTLAHEARENDEKDDNESASDEEDDNAAGVLGGDEAGGDAEKKAN